LQEQVAAVAKRYLKADSGGTILVERVLHLYQVSARRKVLYDAVGIEGERSGKSRSRKSGYPVVVNAAAAAGEEHNGAVALRTGRTVAHVSGSNAERWRLLKLYLHRLDGKGAALAVSYDHLVEAFAEIGYNGVGTHKRCPWRPGNTAAVSIFVRRVAAAYR
jgi:hypothetical protein